MLTTFFTDQAVVGAMRAGASGFLVKDALPDAVHALTPREREASA